MRRGPVHTRMTPRTSDPLWIERGLYRNRPWDPAEQMLQMLMEAVVEVCWIRQVHPTILLEVTVFKE